jgi:outer membrane protein assembly factor BamA
MQIKTSPNDLPDPLNDFANELINEHAYGGLALVAEYDSRDSIFTPSRGLYGKAVLDFYNAAFGSDRNFNNLRTKLFYFNPLMDDLVLGLRAEYQSILGDNRAPAFMTPSIQLRGLPGYEYIGQNALVGELEMRYEVLHRNWLVAFGGTGRAYGDYSSDGDVSFADAPAPFTYGIGYRYELAKAFKLLAGFDVAQHKNDTSFYITVGSAWNAFY